MWSSSSRFSYLLVTKGDPHRRQIGRIAERINAMGTMRLIALRDYNIIRDASTQIQLRGQELDGMMRKWSTGRAAIRRKYTDLTNKKSDDEKSRLKDLEDAEIQGLADAVEALPWTRSGRRPCMVCISASTGLAITCVSSRAFWGLSRLATSTRGCPTTSSSRAG
jgi:hypothetical protein